MLIDICVYSSEKDYSAMVDFITLMSDNVVGYEPVLERANFLDLSVLIVKELLNRSPLWLGNLTGLK
jgi:hypothetical protein